MTTLSCLLALLAAGDLQETIEEANFTGGLAVCVGCDDPDLLPGLASAKNRLVHGLDTYPAKIKAVRAAVRGKKPAGTVFVDTWDGIRLPYVDNLVTLLVLTREASPALRGEAMRVLSPGGALVSRKEGGWTVDRKARPEGMDDWPQYLYQASNNAVSDDRLVGPPGGLQWIAQPTFSRSHEQLASVSAAVSEDGRLFSIEDHGAVESVAFPPEWRLVARDAFNGITLWEREMGLWEWHLHLFRSGPFHLARRLVASGDRVYATLSLGGPVEMLDAATGKTLETFDGTAGADEILLTGNHLLVYVGHTRQEHGGGSEGSGRRKRTPGVSSPPSPTPSALPGEKKLMLLEAATGNTLWEAPVTAMRHCTLGVLGEIVFYQEKTCVVAVGLSDGKERWRSKPIAVNQHLPSTVVGHGKIVILANGIDPRQKGEGVLAGLDAATGETLWTGTCENSCGAPPDLFVADGLAWTGKILLWDQPGFTEGLDPATGEVKRTRKPDQETYDVGMSHHRCYRNKATSRWLISGRAGMEFLDVKTGEIFPSHWVRGTCQYGILPANGLVYAPPHACGCYLTAKLNGFNALRPIGSVDRGTRDPGPALVRGPAFGKIDPDAAAADDWPTFRHDAARSGATACELPAKRKPSWKTDIGGSLTALTVAGGRCFVADDAHSVHALDASTGERAWTFTAGGRVDSPPTIAGGRVVFGSHDGHVYCLRASDGKLAWRFRAAPEDRRIIDGERIASLWPVHGSALVSGESVFVAAGRSTFLDGGIRLCRIDLETGALQGESMVYTPDPVTHRVDRKAIKHFDMEGAQSDVLVEDGGQIYMRQAGFDRDLEPAPVKPHLFSPTGLLDDTWWHRTYWLYGDAFTSGWGAWFQCGNLYPSGRILAFNDEAVFGFGRRRVANCNRGGGNNWALQEQYCFFSAPKTATAKPKDSGSSKIIPVEKTFTWSTKPTIRARAMALTPGRVLFAGAPDHGNAGEAAYAAWQGDKGAKLITVSAKDGTVESETKLDSLPVLDGMAVAGGKVFLSMRDGSVHCFE
jgi:outer membrane protein assembly factor BamB